MTINYHESWEEFFAVERQKPYFDDLISTINIQYSNDWINVYPPLPRVFRVFEMPINEIKVIMLAQDPYSNDQQANGLAFSVNKGINIPPSLQNIFKEIEQDLNIECKKRDGDLSRWEQQGIFLFNCALTVREREPNSHQKLWRPFTDAAIEHIGSQTDKKVFILFGRFARNKKFLITNKEHLILEGTHPSPLSANQGGFFGGKYFSQANDFLIKNNLSPINWQ